MRFHQFSENSAMDDTVEIMKKSFSPERKAVQAEVLELVRAVQMGKGDKMELAMKLTALTKRELEAKRNDPDLKISVNQNIGMMKRAMKAVTGMSEGITEEELTEEQFDEAAGEKDACYRKVKSRYKVWPSAYASGALVKCRKVGAANWGNSKKK